MPSSRPAPATILFLAANPKDTGRLRLDQELRDIGEGLRRSQQRDQFTLEQRLAVRPRDIQRAMLDVNPQIIHFSGHGAGEAGLFFEDEAGNTQRVDGAALAGLFALFADQIQCVVLNGCYSEVQAQAIAEHIPYVIGMNQRIGDKAAIAFAVGFYDALGAGRNVDFAYKLGCAAIQLEGIPGHLTPVLLNAAEAETAVGPIPPSKNASSNPMPAPQSTTGPLDVFISYSHKDEDLKEELEVHLSNLVRQNKIKPWQDRSLEAGTQWDPQIKAALAAARIILLLVTPRFMASNYINDVELTQALERDQAGTARVIPIILKPVDITGTPIAALQALPKDAKPVTRWEDQDEAFLNVVQGIRRVVDALMAPEAEATAPKPTSSAAGTGASSGSTAANAPTPTAATNPIQKRLALFKLLSSLPGPQFEQVVFALSPPAGNVPPASAPQGQRVPALLAWAESPIGCGLGTLEDVVNSILPS